MNETILRQRRALRRAVVRSVIVVAMCAFAAPFAVSAQATATSPEPAARLLLLAGAKKSGPLHEAATVGILIPLRPSEQGSDFGSDFRGYRGVIVEAGAGAEGFELAAGWGRRWKVSQGKGPALFGEDVMATAFQRRSDTAPDATYAGGEVGVTIMTFRVSVGAATRVSGYQDADRTIFTWGIGFNIGK
jgi:hypothetical protein